MWPLRLSAKQRSGQLWERKALAHLGRRGLVPVESNFRCRGGEIDLIMRDGETLVFIEVRQRAAATHGGAAASIGAAKQRRLVRAAQTYLQRFAAPPACRFDVVAVDGEQFDWLCGVIEG